MTPRAAKARMDVVGLAGLAAELGISQTSAWRLANPDYRDRERVKNRLHAAELRKTVRGRLLSAIRTINLRAKARGEPRCNVTVDELVASFAKQAGRCAICGRHKRLCVDHCHRTGKFRGFICGGCNHGLAQLGDDVKGLQRAIRYLKGNV